MMYCGTLATLNFSERRLCAWIHVCMRNLCEKLGFRIDGIFASEIEKEFCFCSEKQWLSHKRLEVNPQHDYVSRELYGNALNESKAIQLERVWVTRLLLNKRNALRKLEKEYKALSGGLSLFTDKINISVLNVSMHNMHSRVPLDNACAGMRRNQWNIYHLKQRKLKRKYDQRQKCVETWTQLRQKRKFDEIAQRLSESNKTKDFLEEAREDLCVHCDFLWMLIMRDLEVLWRGVITIRDMEKATVVGGGAKPVLRQCTPQCEFETWNRRLHILHLRISSHLDKTLVQMVAPYHSRWTLDMTENACCELRRWDEARQHRKRETRSVDLNYRAQIRREDMKRVWKLLGYDAPPPICLH